MRFLSASCRCPARFMSGDSSQHMFSGGVASCGWLREALNRHNIGVHSTKQLCNVSTTAYYLQSGGIKLLPAGQLQSGPYHVASWLFATRYSRPLSSVQRVGKAGCTSEFFALNWLLVLDISSRLPHIVAVALPRRSHALQ